MKQTMTKSGFIDAFRMFESSSGRYSQMGGYKGLEALYEYLTEYEESSGEEIEIDVIALCCDFSCYESFEEIKECYDVEDIDELRNNTTVIEYDEGIIIQNY